MGYLDQLIESHRRPGPLQALAGSIGQMAGGLQQAQTQNAEQQRKLDDRLREIAGRKAEGLMKLGSAAAGASQWGAAAGYANQLPAAAKAAYGIDMPGGDILGAPVMARGREFVEQQGPPLAPGGKVGVMAETLHDYDTGRRTFDDAQTQDAIRGRLGITPKYGQLDPYKVTIDENTGSVVRPADPRPVKTAAADPLLGLKGDKLKAEIARLQRPPVERTPRPDNSAREYQKSFTAWQTKGADYANDYANLMARNQRKYRPGPNNGPAIPVPVDPAQMNAWREEGAKLYRSSVAPPVPPGGVGRQDPFGNPSAPGGAANPAGNQPRPFRASKSRIPPPVKDEDVALLPEFEAHAQEALSIAPGTTISSRARSVNRNAKAKPGGGAKDSWHLHRQAFDLVNATPAQKAALKAWANSRGLWMLDEGNHLHFQPIQGVSAETAPRLASFYEKHGITPGEA